MLKINWIIDVNVKHKNLKLPEITEENLCGLELGKELLDLTPNAQPMKENVDILHFTIKLLITM